MDKDWLSKNVAPILALFIVFCCFGLFVLFSVGRIDPTNRDLVLMVAGGVIGTLGAVVQYFFGSSQGSARKTELLGGPEPPLPYRSAMPAKAVVEDFGTPADLKPPQPAGP